MKRIAEDATRIFLACGATDFRKQIPRLVAAVTFSFKLDPYNGDCVFIFCNRKSIYPILFSPTALTIYSPTNIPAYTPDCYE